MLFNVKFYIRLCLKVVLGPNKIMNMKNFKFCFYFCLLCALSLSHTSPLYVFDISFLKMILERLFMGFSSANYTCYFL